MGTLVTSLGRSVSACLLSLFFAAACGSDSGPAPEGGLLLTMVTSGADLDPNGYIVAFDDGVPMAVAGWAALLSQENEQKTRRKLRGRGDI